MGQGVVSRRRLLGLAVTPAVLAACGRQENLDELPKTAVSEGKVIYSTWGNPHQREVENWSLLAFETNYEGLKVDVVWAQTVAEHVGKQYSLLSGGTPPDVMRLPAWSAPTFYNEEVVLRLDPYFRRDGFRPEEFLAAPYDVATFKRGWYAIPRGQSGTWVVFYNRRAFSQAGLAAPTAAWTWDDFLNAARELTRPGPSGAQRWGVALEPLVEFFYPWLWGAGGDDIDPTRESSAIDQPAAQEALTWLADLRHRHRVAPPAGELADAFAAFVSGQVAMWYGPADAELELATVQPAVDYAIAPQPKGRSGQHGGYRPDVMSLSTIGQHSDDGWELLQFLVDLDAQRLEFQNGLWLPQAKAIVSEESYQRLAGPPFDRRPGIPGLGFRARTPVILPRGDEMRAATLKELTPFWQGTMGVKDATAAASRAVNAILKGGQE
jgi:multiple sugar transport system substrate-binding protein